MVSHNADAHISLTLEPQCCFYYSYCLSERVFLTPMTAR